MRTQLATAWMWSARELGLDGQPKQRGCLFVASACDDSSGSARLEDASFDARVKTARDASAATDRAEPDVRDAGEPIDAAGMASDVHREQR